jgi:hypothetical protein
MTTEAWTPSTELELYDRRELTEDRRDSLVIRTYWLRVTNGVVLSVVDERQDRVYPEVVIPPDKVLDARDHPFAYLDGTTDES